MRSIRDRIYIMGYGKAWKGEVTLWYLALLVSIREN